MSPPPDFLMGTSCKYKLGRLLIADLSIMSGSVVVCAVNEKTPPTQTPPTNTMVTIDSANTIVIALDLRIALI